VKSLKEGRNCRFGLSLQIVSLKVSMKSLLARRVLERILKVG
jgi:hypothetical protein